MTQYILNNNVPLVDKSQEFKEQVINNALLATSCLTRSVLTRTLATPPGSPADESLYIIPPTGSTGDWANKANQLVLYYNSLPLYFQPYEGLVVFVIDEQVWYNYHGSAWEPINTGASGGSTNPLTAIGDIYVGRASGAASRLPVGTNGSFLQADSAQTLGLKWQSIPTLPTTSQAQAGFSPVINSAGTAYTLQPGLPLPALALAGFVPVVNAQGTAYTLQQVSSGSGSGGSTTTFSNTPPNSPTQGTSWFSQSTNKLYLYQTDSRNLSAWVPVGTGNGLFAAYPLELNFNALPLANSALDHWALGDSLINNVGITLGTTVHVGTNSGAFNGRSYIDITSTIGDVFDFGSGDYTVALWFNLSSFDASGNAILFSKWQNPGYSYIAGVTASSVNFSSQSATGALDSGVSGSVSINTGTWYHYAISRLAGQRRLFLNGTLLQTTTDFTQYSSNATPFIIGANGDAGIVWNVYGFVEQFRVYRKGIYTANFTPPNS